MSSRGGSPAAPAPAPGQEPNDEDFEAVNASVPPAASDDEEDVDVNAVAEEMDDDDGAGADAGAVSEDDDQAEDAALGNEALREVAKRERERLRAVKRARAEELKRLKATEDQDFATDQASRLKKRMQFLLKQADIFQHFMPSGVAAAKADAADAKDAASKKKKKSRHATGRASEDAEDAALLADEAAEDGDASGHRLTVQPGVIKGTMRKYQMEGLNWLIHLYDNSMNGILADEMGLGKTLQTISLLGYLHEFRGIAGPHLVIVPKSTLHNWINEFRKWCPVIRAVKFHGDKAQRADQKANIMVKGAFDVCVTSFEMVIKEKATFLGFKWKYVIIDEAHRIKNEKSVLFQAVKRLDTCYRLLITGTPLQNNLHELWALLHFLLPEMFSSSDAFEEWFSAGSTTDPGGGAGEGGEGGEAETEVVSQLHKVLRPFLLRRLKSDVEKGLPPKKETILKIGMSALQKKTYSALLQRDIEAVNGAADRSRLLNVVMQLRKCCNHPYLFQGTEPGPPYTTGEHLVEASGKMVLLDKLLPKLQSRDSRVLIFSQMTRLLDILEDYCLFRGYQYCRIDGNTSGEDREAQIDAYNAEGSEKFIFLLSTRAGGLGINLYTADVVVLYDSDWNPQMDLQAMDRAHRIGQKKEVQVFRLCVEHSIEEKVIEKAYKKLRLDALVIQQGRLTENASKNVNKEDLLQMVRYGAEMVFSSEAASLTDEDIDAIIKKGERATEDLNQKMQQFADGAMKFTLDGGVGNVYEYKDGEEGGDAATAAGADGEALRALIGNNWIDPPKRERKRVQSYNEAEAFRQTLKPGGGGGPRASAAPRLPKMPQLQDFQFYDVPRITALYEKEANFEAHKHSLAEKARSARAQGASEEVVQAQIAPGPDDPQPLSEEEVAEREALLSSGFANWNRRDFGAFIRACEKYGRNDPVRIATEVDGKSEAEVAAYLEVFRQRCSELNESERLLRNIHRGEERLARHAEVADLIRAKLAQYKNPWSELRLSYGSNKGKAYTEEEDRFILCSVEKLGYGRWEELKAAARASHRFRFDWYFKSRTPQELARRCDTLIRLVEAEKKEEEEGGAGARAGGGQGKKGGGGSRASSVAPDDGGDGDGDGKEAKRARSTSAAGADAEAADAPAPMAVDEAAQEQVAA